HTLAFEDFPQLFDEFRRAKAVEVKTLAARGNGRRNLVRLGGGKDKDDVGRRLLQDLQEGVEGLVGQHVDFVDDVDFVPAVRRRVVHPVPDLAYLVDAAV